MNTPEAAGNLLDSLPLAAVVRSRRDGRLLAANPRAEKIFLNMSGNPELFSSMLKHFEEEAASETAWNQMFTFENTGVCEVRGVAVSWSDEPAWLETFIELNGLSASLTQVQKEKEQLEQYFQTVVENLPGGVAVVRCETDGTLVPEYLSDGFAAMTGMTIAEAWQLYREDALNGVHPEDREVVSHDMAAYVASHQNHCEMIYRLRKGNGDYFWVKNTLSLIQNEGGDSRVYAVYHDLTREREEQARLRRQYNELILQHYRTPGPDALIVGHCNITRNLILDVLDYTGEDVLHRFGSVREQFFTGMSELVTDPEQRRIFRSIYLNRPALEAFRRGDTERRLTCFIKLPSEKTGRYAEIKMNMVKTPDSGDVTGILTVTDVTEKTIAERIMHQLSVSGYDFVVDVNLLEDRFVLLSHNDHADTLTPASGSYLGWADTMFKTRVLPKDREIYRTSLDPQRMLQRLKTEDAYTFTFSITNEHGEIRTKNMTVSAVDLRLGRVCLSRTDITNSVREQQGLLRAIAVTFELAAFIDVGEQRMTLYTRKAVLENLPPHTVDHYDQAMWKYVENNTSLKTRQETADQFMIESMVKHLNDSPSGYDFLFSAGSDEKEQVKQVTVLWGDTDHKTICLVRQDVTDMLAEERRTKKALENALALAEEASQAKSDFLSAMSHDIRTPMNAIMGMTALAAAHQDDPKRVADCLQKISSSSKHLLSLINDILDMSKIERSKIILNRMEIHLPDLINQLSAMLIPQARAAGLKLSFDLQNIVHETFFGDALRINQILINILGNAIKFTASGGMVQFTATELPATERSKTDFIRYQFVIADTGAGMSAEFLEHIFDPFTRSRTVDQIEGTGLGLSITKGLVDLMGGEIRVESQVGRGSVFTIELELEAGFESAESERQSDKPEIAADQNPSLGRHFLIVEDNAINAEILSEILKLEGATSAVRTNGFQAVQEFESTPPGTYDAILMDIQMPLMNGYEATRKIRSLPRPDAGLIPILAMTANAFAEDVQASLASGMSAHVAKPIDLALLREALKKVL